MDRWLVRTKVWPSSNVVSNDYKQLFMDYHGDFHRPEFIADHGLARQPSTGVEATHKRCFGNCSDQLLLPIQEMRVYTLSNFQPGRKWPLRPSKNGGSRCRSRCMDRCKLIVTTLINQTCWAHLSTKQSWINHTYAACLTLTIWELANLVPQKQEWSHRGWSWCTQSWVNVSIFVQHFIWGAAQKDVHRFSMDSNR